MMSRKVAAPNEILQDDIRIENKSYEQIFKDMDVDGEGKLTMAKLHAIVEKKGHSWSREKLIRMVNLVGHKSNSALEVNEFIQFMELLENNGSKLYEEVFKGLDMDGDGKLNMDELHVIVEKEGHSWSRERLVRMVNLVDHNANGTVEINEFIELMKLLDNNGSKLYAKVFRDLDMDGDGKLSMDELHRIVEKEEESWSREKVQRMVNLVDQNSNGTVEINEFIDLMSRGPHLLEKEEMLEGFQFIDRHRKGFVSLQTLKLILTKGSAPLKDGIGELLKFSDSKGDGKVYYNDVVAKIYEGIL